VQNQDVRVSKIASTKCSLYNVIKLGVTHQNSTWWSELDANVLIVNRKLFITNGVFNDQITAYHLFIHKACKNNISLW